MQRDTGAAAGRREVGARFIVHSYEEGAAKPRPYLRPPCGGPVDEGSSTLPGAEGDAIAGDKRSSTSPKADGQGRPESERPG